MPSIVVITIKDPGFLVGVRGIEFLLDGRGQGVLQFGDIKEFEVHLGQHVAKVILHGVIDRSSKELRFSLGEDQTVRIEGKYSRLWGNMSISLV